MAEIIPFRSRKQLSAQDTDHVRVLNMLDQATADIERIIGFGCQHERVAWMGMPPMQVKVCLDCQKTLGQVGT